MRCKSKGGHQPYSGSPACRRGEKSHGRRKDQGKCGMVPRIQDRIWNGNSWEGTQS
uniref:Uncharacterized protein n=1 Tax=Arundo donax TaxID=35708 RepID=A0A0A8YIY3_ARUDO